MYTPPKQPEQGKIRLARSDKKPTMQILVDMLTQASANKPREVELTWSEPASGKTYSLGSKFEHGAYQASWTLWEDDGVESKMTWRYDSSDCQLIEDMLHMLDSAPKPAAQQQPAAPQNPFSPSAQQQPASPQNPFFPNVAAPRPEPPQARFERSGPNPIYQPPAPPAQSQYERTGPQPVLPNQFSQAAFERSGPQPTVPDAPRRPITTGFVPPFSPTASQDNDRPYAAPERPPGTLEGSLKELPVPTLLQSVASSQRTGKLEVIAEQLVGEVYFEAGRATHAATPNAYGDAAIEEMVTWDVGTYLFTPELRTDMRSVQRPLEGTIAEGRVRSDQKKHLKRAGLTFESYLVPRHNNLSDTELKLMLTKGEPLDWEFQQDIYRYLRHKRTLTDLLRDKPMSSEKWTVLLYNFLSCGLIDIKEAESVKGTQLDFLGEAKGQVEAITNSFIRPETGIYHAQALLFFLQYEYFRFEAYNYPLSLIVFEMQKKRDELSQIIDLLSPQAANIAAMRIDLVKRPLDVLGHFETVDYALLLPNTRSSSAAFVANRIHEVLTATPLAKGHDCSTLLLSFGVASLPSDGDDLESLVKAAKAAKEQAKIGTFPVVLSRQVKRN